MKRILFYCVVVSIVFTACSKDDGTPTPTPNPEPTNQIPKELAIDSTQVFNELISSGTEISRLGLRFDFSDFQPTGVYVKANAMLKLNVKQLQGNRLPKLLVGTYSHGSEWNKQPTTYNLQLGDNSITITEAGLVYVKYSDDVSPNGKVEIKFNDGWEHTPYYKINETSNATWKKMLDYFKDAPSVTLESNKAFLVVTKSKAIVHQDENQNALLIAIDETFELYNELSGMDSSSDWHKPMSHKLLMTEYLGTQYYMFAYYYRTAYNGDGVRYILDESDFKEDGWGPWHEIGHMYQMGAWTWNELGEVTVNIYSLAAEKHKGITESRMKRENKWAEIATYLNLPDNERSFNTDKASVWVRLGMFYQLQLAFGDNFYKTLHKKVREDQPLITGDEDRMKTLMLYACKVSNKDLTDFFKKWGLKFNGVDNVYTEIQNLNLTAPASDLTQLTD